MGPGNGIRNTGLCAFARIVYGFTIKAIDVVFLTVWRLRGHTPIGLHDLPFTSFNAFKKTSSFQLISKIKQNTLLAIRFLTQQGAKSACDSRLALLQIL